MPPLMDQINHGNWLPQQEAEQLRDDLYYHNAVQAYITMLPALNTIGMRDGSKANFGKGYNILPIWKDRMDSRTWVPTPNADVVYSMSYLDLKETGPPVVATPPNVIGMFTDFPLWAVEKDVKPMQFPNASGKRVNMMYPMDNTYWTKLKAFVDYKPISAIDLEYRGLLAAIGIVKGQPFQPTAKQQDLLKNAVETAPKMILAYRQLGRPDKRNLYYKDRQYENIWAGGTSEWMQDGYLDVDQRAAYSSSPTPRLPRWSCAR